MSNAKFLVSDLPRTADNLFSLEFFVRNINQIQDDKMLFHKQPGRWDSLNEATTTTDWHYLIQTRLATLKHLVTLPQPTAFRDSFRTVDSIWREIHDAYCEEYPDCVDALLAMVPTPRKAPEFERVEYSAENYREVYSAQFMEVQKQIDAYWQMCELEYFLRRDENGILPEPRADSDYFWDHMWSSVEELSYRLMDAMIHTRISGGTNDVLQRYGRDVSMQHITDMWQHQQSYSAHRVWLHLGKSK